MYFTPNYQEEIILPNHTRARLRLVRPDDKARLRQILAGMSAHSRAMRFFVARREFSEAELRYLTEIDGLDHFAVLALQGNDSVGVARFVRQAPGSDVAEPAFAVIDRFQRRGLGRLLVARLAAAARERGIARFEAEVLPENGPMLRLLRELDPTVPSPAPARPGLDSITCTVDLVRAAAVDRWSTSVPAAAASTGDTAPPRRAVLP